MMWATCEVLGTVEQQLLAIRRGRVGGVGVTFLEVFPNGFAVLTGGTGNRRLLQ